MNIFVYMCMKTDVENKGNFQILYHFSYHEKIISAGQNGVFFFRFLECPTSFAPPIPSHERPHEQNTHVEPARNQLKYKQHYRHIQNGDRRWAEKR